MAATPPSPKKKFFRRCRLYFRRLRMVLWLLILSVLGGLTYLNQVGLPGIIKTPLLQKLRARGIELQFSRLRLRWEQGIVADNVRFGRAERSPGPELTAAEVQVHLDWNALKRFQIQVDELQLRRGRLVYPVAEESDGLTKLNELNELGGPEAVPTTGARQLIVTNINTQLRLLPDDQWALEDFRASFYGAALRVSGALSNASAIAAWGELAQEQAASAGFWQLRLRHLADTFDHIQFSGEPRLHLNVRGDANDLDSFRVHLVINAPGAESPWGSVSEGRFVARLTPAASNELTHAEITLEAKQARTPWAAASNLVFNGRIARKSQTARIKLQTEGQRSPLAEDIGSYPWAWVTNLENMTASWECHATDLQFTNFGSWAVTEPGFRLALAAANFEGAWQAPELTLSNLWLKCSSEQSDRPDLEATARLNLVSRQLAAQAQSRLDPHQIAPLLTGQAQQWLDQFSWREPPVLRAEASVVLPAWTNRQPDWKGQVQPTLRLQGQFDIGQGGTYRGLPVTSARSHFSYSNLVWHLPDLIVRPDRNPRPRDSASVTDEPEQTVRLEHRADERARQFYWRISSNVDPQWLQPLLRSNELRVLDLFKFTQPPLLEAQVWGRGNDPENLGFQARVAATNFTFRGMEVSAVQTGVEYTNRVLRFNGPRVQRGQEQASADGLSADFNSQAVYLTNALSTVDPLFIARAIGPKIGRAIEPYHFMQPPTGHVYGVIPMRGEELADLHFLIDGGQFRWLKFDLGRLKGDVHWRGEELILTNVQAEFYGGEARGKAHFLFHPQNEEGGNTKPPPSLGSGAASKAPNTEEISNSKFQTSNSETRHDSGALPLTPGFSQANAASNSLETVSTVSGRDPGVDYAFEMVVTNAQLQALISGLTTNKSSLEGKLSGELAITSANTADTDHVNGRGRVALGEGLIWSIPVFGILSPVLDTLMPGLGSSRINRGSASFVITNSVIRSEDLEMRSTTLRLRYRGTVDFQQRVNARVEAELLRDVWGVGPVVSALLMPVTKLFEYKVTGTVSHPKKETVVPVIPKIVLLPFQLPFHPFRTLKGLVPEEGSRTNASPGFQEYPNAEAPGPEKGDTKHQTPNEPQAPN